MDDIRSREREREREKEREREGERDLAGLVIHGFDLFNIIFQLKGATNSKFVYSKVATL